MYRVTALAAIATMVFSLILSSPERAHAGNTRVVISLSVGGGAFVGMVGWFIHLSYSHRVASRPDVYAGSEGSGLGEGGTAASLVSGGHPRNPALFQEAPQSSPRAKTAFIRLVEIPW